jgi:CSLREA domain-containing protein
VRAKLAVIAAVSAFLLVGVPSALAAATVNVTTQADEYDTSGSGTGCSLREAIKSVDGSADFGGCTSSGTYSNSDAVPDTIMLPAGTYNLTRQTGPPDDTDVSGDLDVFHSMDIVGTGNPTIHQTLSGGNGERVLDVTATGKKLSLSGLTISGGDAVSGGNGGGIHFVGAGGTTGASLTLNNVTVTGNDTQGTGNGGGIWTDSPTTITNSFITNNKAAKTNGTSGNGGGIYQDGMAGPFTGVTLSVDHTTITGNTADNSTAPFGGSGGGIFRFTKSGDVSSTATVTDSDISGNTGHYFGGGIANNSDSTFTITRSLISGNHAPGLRGGGIEDDSVAGSGQGTLSLINTTVTGNDAAVDGGGIHVGNSSPPNLNLLFSTLAYNSGNPGSELAFSGNSSPKPNYTVEGTIFAATNPSANNACNISGSGFANRTDNGYNVSTDPTDATLPAAAGPGCGIFSIAPGDRTGLNAALVNPLADKGGPTQTMQPTAASFATDNMPNATCTSINPAVTMDQRGFPRPNSAGANCDSGAYEAYTCNGALVNTPGPFTACPPPNTGGGGGAGGGGGTTTTPGPTGQRAAALKKCKKKKSAQARKKCRKKAGLLPV